MQSQSRGQAHDHGRLAGLSKDVIAAYRQKGAETAGIARLFTMLERGDFDLIAAGGAPIANADQRYKICDGQSDRLAAFDPKVLETLA